jgi:hypothetical protein
MLVPVSGTIPHPWIDSSQAPLYVWRFPAEASYDDCTAFCQARETWARDVFTPVAWVVDLTLLQKADARHRQIFGEHLKRFERYDRRCNAGSALVVPNAWLRGVVTAVFWLSPPGYPNKLFADFDSAIDWARDRLGEAGNVGFAHGTP